MNFTLLDDTDVSQAYAAYLRELRKQAKLSRAALAERSCVPAATIKKFELTGQISFRQLLLLWQTLDSLERLYQLTQPSKERVTMPSSIDEVVRPEIPRHFLASQNTAAQSQRATDDHWSYVGAWDCRTSRCNETSPVSHHLWFCTLFV